MKSKYGQYVVGQGYDFKIKLSKEPSKTIGHDIELFYNQQHDDYNNQWYVVQASTLKVMGCYEAEYFATHLAVSLDKRDQKKLADEMERILAEENDEKLGK